MIPKNNKVIITVVIILIVLLIYILLNKEGFSTTTTTTTTTRPCNWITIQNDCPSDRCNWDNNASWSKCHKPNEKF